METTAAVTGCDRKTKAGDDLSMHYAGTLAADGSQFDSSRDRGTPFSFALGQGNVIVGWDKGLVGMCVGEKRLLTIPPALGYGDRGAGGKFTSAPKSQVTCNVKSSRSLTVCLRFQA